MTQSRKTSKILSSIAFLVSSLLVFTVVSPAAIAQSDKKPSKKKKPGKAKPTAPPSLPKLPSAPGSLPKPPESMNHFYDQMKERIDRISEENDDAYDRKLYRRWNWAMEDRLGPDDNFIDVAVTKRSECAMYKKGPEYLENQKNAKFAGFWTPIGPTHYNIGPGTTSGGMGRVNVLAFHPREPKTIYAGSASGALWQSLDRGLSWQPLTDAFGVSGIAIDPIDTETIYCLTGDGNGYGGSAYFLSSVGVLKSTDRGMTWQDTTPLVKSGTTYYGYALRQHPTKSGTLFATTNIGSFKTSDGGNSWVKVLDNYSYDIEFKPGNPSTVYISTQYQIYRSTEDGEPGTFEEVATFPFPDGSTKRFYGSSRVELAVTLAEPAVVYAVFGGKFGLAGLYRSNDSGKTFSLRSNTPNVLGVDILGQSLNTSSWYNLAIAAAPLDPDHIYAAGVNIWRSTNGGVMWKLDSTWDKTDPTLFYRYTHGDTHDLVFHRGSLYAATDGGVFMRTLGDDTWTDLSSGLSIAQIYRLCGSPDDADYLYYGCQDNGFNRLLNTVAVQIYLGDGATCLIDPEDPTNFYAAFPPANYLLRPAENDTLTAVPPPGGQSSSWVLPIAAHPDDFQTVYSCYTDLWKTDDGGATWVVISDDDELGSQDEKNHSCVKVAVTSAGTSQPAYIYVAKETAVFRAKQSKTNDHVWENLTSELCPESEGCPHVTDLVFNPVNHEEIWVSLSGFHDDNKVYRRARGEDGSYSWVNMTGTLPNVPANALLFDNEAPHGIYLGMECGVYYRDDTLADWISFDGPPAPVLAPGVLPSVMVQDLLIQYDKHRKQKVIRAGTFNWGVWESPLYSFTPAPGQVPGAGH